MMVRPAHSIQMFMSATRYFVAIMGLQAFLFWGMQDGLESAHAKKIAHVRSILNQGNADQSLNDMQWSNIEVIFNEDNDQKLAWFEKHKSGVQAYLQKYFPQVVLQIAGSRKWHISHLLSDIDVVVIADEEDDHQKIITLLDEYYQQYYPDIDLVKRKTQAGFHLLQLTHFYDPSIGFIKIEYVVLTTKIHAFVENRINERFNLKFSQPFDTVRYASQVMIAYLDKNESRLSQLKEWLWIMPPH